MIILMRGVYTYTGVISFVFWLMFFVVLVSELQCG
jgi:hypothetical protein